MYTGRPRRGVYPKAPAEAMPRGDAEACLLLPVGNQRRGSHRDRRGRLVVLTAVDEDRRAPGHHPRQALGGEHWDADAAVARRVGRDVAAAVNGDAADDVQGVVHLAERAGLPPRRPGEDLQMSAGRDGVSLRIAFFMEGLAAARGDG